MSNSIDTISALPVSLSPSQTPSKGPVRTSDTRETPAGIDAAQKPAPPKNERKPEKELEQAINDRLERLLGSNLRLRIELDKESGQYVYQNVNKATGQVDHQYPSESVLRMLAFFRDLEGLILDKKA